MIFKNNSCLIFTLFINIFVFTEIFGHNLQKRQTQEQQNCGQLTQIPNGKIISLSEEFTIGSSVPNNAVIIIVCDENFEPSTQNKVLKCVDGAWNTSIPNCIPKRSLNEAEESRENVEICGEWDGYSQAPWHVGLYEKNLNQYKYFCGGTIVSSNVIVTAAHCFVDDEGKKIDATNVFIGAGKHRSDYNAPSDWSSQYSQAKKYIFPDVYKGALSNLEGDLALLVLQQPFSMNYFVQPACIDWENKFESEQLSPGNIGYVQGWGYTNLQLKTPSPTLQQLNVPIVEKQQCLGTVPKSFQIFVTEDKFCAGYTNGSCICNGDDGGGLVFGKTDKNEIKYYIRGLVSTYPKQNGACDMHQYAVYTKISSHKNLIEQIINEHKIKQVKNS